MSDNVLSVTIPITSSTSSGYTFGDQYGNLPQAGTFTTTSPTGQIINVSFSPGSPVAGDAIATVIAKSANFTVAAGTTSGNLYDVTTASSNITATLPAASVTGNGWYLWLRKSDAGSGLVLTSPVVSPAAFAIGTQGHTAFVWSNGTNYFAKQWLGGTDVSGNITTTSNGIYTINGTSVVLGASTSVAGTGITTTVIGGTLAVKSGSNAKAGTFTLIAGAATIANTSITANSVISPTLKTVGGTIASAIYVATITPATGFTVAGGGGSNTSTYNYIVTEVN